LGELGLKARLLEGLDLLVGVDDFGTDEVVKALSGVFGNQAIDLRGIGLEGNGD
jgi:hypothetical protein